jgi:hypothetical protein
MHIIATLSLALCTTAALAQPTLQIADFPAAINLDWYLLTDPGSITEPSNGTDQTWDFTSATWALAGTVGLAPAAGTPYAAQYPAANYVFIATPTGQASVYSYLLVGPDGFEVICGDAPLNTEVYTNYKTVLQTPLAYGNAFTDNNDGTQGPGSETWTYTGAGTLLTDLGDFTNTVKTVRTADGRVGLWNSAPLFPRITVNGPSVNLYTDASTSIGERGSSNIALIVHPTSATSEITIEAVDAGARWTILDALGRVMRSGSFSTQGVQRLNIAEFATGPYVVNVTDASGTHSARFQKL